VRQREREKEIRRRDGRRLCPHDSFSYMIYCSMFFFFITACFFFLLLFYAQSIVISQLALWEVTRVNIAIQKFIFREEPKYEVSPRTSAPFWPNPLISSAIFYLFRTRTIAVKLDQMTILSCYVESAKALKMLL
jgi:hypothetical protein